MLAGDPKQSLKEMVDRFGWEGLDELSMIDGKVEALLHRMLIVTTIAHNLYIIDQASGEAFLKRFDPMIEQAQIEIEKLNENFVLKRGEM